MAKFIVTYEEALEEILGEVSILDFGEEDDIDEALETLNKIEDDWGDIS